MQTDPERIASLERRVADLEAQLSLLYDLVGGRKPAAYNGEYPGELIALCRESKIMAIKRYRELYNVGLAEAKTAIEEMQAKLGIE